jgi:RecA-family ATPase
MAPETGRNERLYRAAFRMGTMVARGWIERATVEGRLLEACRTNALEQDTGAVAVRASLRSGLDGGVAVPHADLDEQQNSNEARRDSPLPPLQWLNMSSWDSEPAPLREWAILDRSPLNQVGLFSGHGGTGKSLVELTKDVAHVAGRDWFGSMPALGPAIYIGAEDDAGEIHRRLADIAAHYGMTFKVLIEGGLHVLCLLGQDATLCAASGKSGRVEVTDLYRQIHEAAGDIKPKNISIDTLSRAFAGNEIDRVQVYGFAMHMQALAMVAGGSVTVLSHPSLQGMSSGSGISGSTAWHNAFRFRHYLKGVKPADSSEQPDNDLRELEFLKNQYGSLGERVILRYQNGLFLPEAGISNLDKLVREARVEEIFIAGLGRVIQQGRDAIVGENSPEFGPTLIAELPEVKKERVRKKDLVDAMNRLLAANKIHIGKTDGPPSRAKKCLRVGPRA